MNPRSTDCEADALTTTPSRLMDQLSEEHLSKALALIIVRQSRINKYRYDVTNKLPKLPNSLGIEEKVSPMLSIFIKFFNSFLNLAFTIVVMCTGLVLCKTNCLS